jgi:hypothetical protein
MLNTHVIAAAMKEHIFDPCITRGMYGRWETDEWSMVFHHTKSSAELPADTVVENVQS